MKKIAIVASLFTSLYVFSQETKMYFTDKLVYEKIVNPENEIISSEMYVSKNGMLIKENDYNFNSFFYDNENSKTYHTAIGLGNKLKLNKYLSYYSFYDEFEEKEQVQEGVLSQLKNTNKQETIGNHKCTVYQLDYYYQANQETETTPYLSIYLYIDEQSSLNNVPYFLSSGSSIAGYYLPKTSRKPSVKGLIIKLENVERSFFIALKSTEKINETAYFDFKKDKEEVKKYAEEQIKLMKSFYADSASASAAEPVEVSENLDNIPEYNSAYKNERKTDLAMNNLPSKNYEKALPKYCFRIKEEIPDFSNKQISAHLQNYVGQLCDLYLSEAEVSGVDKKATIDEIRREALWLLKNREKLNKNDKKMLDRYLENLD
jgi:hypothetical protein